MAEDFFIERSSRQFRLGEWTVRPSVGRIERGSESILLEPRALDILAYLARRPRQVVSVGELITEVWAGQIVCDNTVYQWMHKIRKSLGDDSHAPTYIETVPKKGYRLIAEVEFQGRTVQGARRTRKKVVKREWALLGVLLLVVSWGFWASTKENVPAPPILEQASISTLAVLPFSAHPGDGEAEHFASGLHEELLSKLSLLDSLDVISRTSVMQFQGEKRNLRIIGQQLNAGAIIEGGVQRAGDRFRIHVQLIDTQTDTHLWSETYDRQTETANLFAIQTEIANAVAEVLSIELSQEEEKRLSREPTRSLEAFDAFLMGQNRFAVRTIPAMMEAVEHFQRAVVLDPEYARAWVGLADAYEGLHYYGAQPADELKAASKAAIDRALELDDRLGEAYASLGGWILYSDPEAAAAAFRTSFELSPNYAPAYHWYGDVLNWLGQVAESQALYEKAQHLDPLSPIINMDNASTLERLGRLDDALVQYQRVVAIDPGFRSLNHNFGAFEISGFGRFDRAYPYFLREIEYSRIGEEPLPGHLASAYVDMAILYLQLEDFEAAQEMIEQSRLHLPGNLFADYVEAKLIIMRSGGFTTEQLIPLPDLDALEAQASEGSVSSRFVAGILHLYRNMKLHEGRFLEALEMYTRFFPDLMQSENPEIDLFNLHAAIDVALVLNEVGEEKRAELLLVESLKLVQKTPRLGRWGFGIADVNIHALRGDREKALSALEDAMAQGWRDGALFYLQYDPNLASLRGDKTFEDVLALVKTDLGSQRREVQKWQKEMPLVLLGQNTFGEK